MNPLDLVELDDDAANRPQRAIIRRNIPAIVFHAFNWTFISFIQSVLLFGLSSPTYVILLASQLEPKLKIADYGFVALELGLIATEFVADQQQWDYHAAKGQYQKTAQVPQGYQQAELDRGFVSTGLWAYSRHPAFACEQSIWITLYQWSCFASRSLYNWSGFGVLGLLGIFQGSVWLTEMISAGKYAEYKEYQRQVGTFVPKNLTAYESVGPKVIRTSDLAKKKQGPKEN
jgi:steroid 5-alpha reductase family enzyme